jgi:spore coat protein SA
MALFGGYLPDRRKRNLNLLIVAPEQFPVPGNGSVEICILSIARLLAKRHSVTVVSRAAAGMPAESKEGGVEIVRVRAGSPKIYLASVLRYLRGKIFDCIQVDNRPHYMAVIRKAVTPKTKVTLFLHSLTFVPQTSHAASSIKHADLIIANSRSLNQQISSRFPAVSQKIRTVELGVDTGRFHPPSDAERTQAKLKYRMKGDFTFTVLFIGRIIPQKGVHVLLKAVQLASRQLPVKLVIAGKGNPAYMKQLRKQAAKLGVSVIWAGKVSHAEIHRLYQLADCFVCPSQRHEAFGLVNVEAMASGLPVIASKTGGIPEIVKHGESGYLVDRYHRPESFAEYLVRLGKNSVLRSALGKAGRSIVLERFTWSQTASRLASLYGGRDSKPISENEEPL